jgi:hypothetical protein
MNQKLQASIIGAGDAFRRQEQEEKAALEREKQIEQMQKRRKSLADVESEFAPPLTQLEDYKKQVSLLDTQIAAAEKDLLETGNTGALNTIGTYEQARNRQLNNLRNFLAQTRQIDEQLNQLTIASGSPGAGMAETFRKANIDPLVKAIKEQVAAPGTRNLWIQALQQQIAQFNKILTDADALARKEKAVAELAASIQKDVSGATGVNGLIARFKSDRLDHWLTVIKDINTEGDKRNRYAGIYTQEQEKLLAIRWKVLLLPPANCCRHKRSHCANRYA